MRHFTVLCCTALATLAGCASVDMSVAPDPARFQRGPDAPPVVPLTVGYVIPDSYRSSVVRTPNGSVGWRPYRDLEPAWRAMLGNVYAGVVRLDADAPAQVLAASGVRFVVWPELATAEAPAGGLLPRKVFTVELGSAIRCLDGTLAARPQVATQATAGGPGMAFDEGAAGRQALEDALLQMRRMLAALPPVCG